jgi:hypothetical protein
MRVSGQLAVLDPDVVEEAGLERALGGRRPVKPPGRCPADRAMSKGNIPVGEDLGQLHPEIGKALPDLADRFLRLVPAHESLGEPDAGWPAACPRLASRGPRGAG